MTQAVLPETIERPTRHLLARYRFAWCKSCAAQTCHSFLGGHTWECDTCHGKRTDRKLWVRRPVLARLKAW